nr:uncharacterized protein LOC116281958 [Vicugna pacos]
MSPRQRQRRAAEAPGLRATLRMKAHNVCVVFSTGPGTGLVREFVAQNTTMQIKHVIQTLSQEFALSQHPHSRKGGLIGLAACSIALGKDSGLYLKELIEPVLTCFNDADSRLRYYACEALYNIVKVARGAVLPHFNVLFDGLSKLAADPDPNVKSGSELLDRLLKAVRAWMLWGPLLPGSGSTIFPHSPWPQAAHVPLTHRMSRQKATVQPTELHPFVVGEDLFQQAVCPAVHHLLDPCASRFEELRAHPPQPLRSTHLTSVSHQVWSSSGWVTQSRSGTGGGSSSPGWRVLSPFFSAHW